MAGEPEPNLGLSRRDLLQRGAVLGLGLAWSVPFVRSVPVAAFAGSPEPRFHGIGHLGIVFLHDDVTYRAMYESEPVPRGRWVDTTSPGGAWRGLPDCPPPPGWSTETTVGLVGAVVPAAGQAIRAKMELVEDEPWRITITLPPGCTFAGDVGVAMGGKVCVSGVVGPSNVVVFTAPADTTAV